MVHARQHSTGYIPSNKVISPSNMMCTYTPSSVYPSGGVENVGSWSITSSQSYDAIESYSGSDQRRAWISQESSHYGRRDRRLECRAIPPSTPDLSSHATSINSPYTPASYIDSPPPSRSPIYQAPHRQSVNIQAPTSSWAHWDIEQTPTPPLSEQRFNGVSSPSWSELNVHIPSYSNNASYSDLYSSSDSSSALYTPPPDQNIPLNGFAFPHRFSPVSSPSPSPVHHRSSGSPPTIHSRRHSDVHASETTKSCSHCHATSTPLWRRDPNTMKPLCNACGLYLQQRNKLRPQELIDADDDGSSSEESDVNYVGPECSHCRTHHTSVWRRSRTGEQLCNACGVYARLRGKPRPLSLKRNKIRPRSKHSPK